MFYIYQADVYCEECGEALRGELDDKGHRPDNPDGEGTYDSGDYPKGPYPYEETDVPEHCGCGKYCLDPLIINDEKYGKFFGNPLTEDGLRYVLETAREYPQSEIVKLWMETYGDDWLDGKSLREHLES